MPDNLPLLDSALPFQRVATNHSPPAARPITISAADGVVLPRRSALAQLGHPGALVPLTSFLSSFAPLASFAASAPAPRAELHSADVPSGTPSANVTLAPADSPWLGRPVESSGATSQRSEPVDTALCGASPWLQTPSMPPAALVAQLAPLTITNPSPQAPLPLEAQASGGSRWFMTALLVVAALALLGAIVAIAVRGQQKSPDTADVKAGQTQRDYTLAAPPVTAQPSATASAAPARPVFRNPVAAPPPAAGAAPAAKPKDIYDDL